MAETDETGDLSVDNLDDLRIRGIRPLVPSACLIEDVPADISVYEHVSAARAALSRAVRGEDSRLVIIAGPVSAHDPVACLEYAKKLKVLQEKLSNKASLELTPEEIKELKVADLPPSSFIKVGDKYMEVSIIQHPAGNALEWVEFADSPGIKGEPRSREKMKLDYGGQANKLKDLARLTLRFTHPSKMVCAIKELKALGFTIVICKNKYARTTPSRC